MTSRTKFTLIDNMRVNSNLKGFPLKYTELINIRIAAMDLIDEIDWVGASVVGLLL